MDHFAVGDFFELAVFKVVLIIESALLLSEGSIFRVLQIR